MSAVLEADDRSGPTMSAPEEQSIRERTDAEVPDAPQIADDIRKAAEDKKAGRASETPWSPEGFYWGYNKQGDAVLKPQEWYVKDIATDAEHRLVAAIAKHGKSEELRERIKRASAALKEYLQERRAINDKSFARRLKAEADDASYQIVQAAKYRRDGITQMENNRRNGYSAENQKTKDLRNWMENSMYEGYALTMIVLSAAEDSDVTPTFDYTAAAWRVCNYSAQRLTETLMAKQRNNTKADNLAEQAARTEAESYFG